MTSILIVIGDATAAEGFIIAIFPYPATATVSQAVTDGEVVPQEVVLFITNPFGNQTHNSLVLGTLWLIVIVTALKDKKY